jgi:hypothetical protein
MTGTIGGMATVFFICTVLAVLEISLSFDNAIVNANKLKEMTPESGSSASSPGASSSPSSACASSFRWLIVAIAGTDRPLGSAQSSRLASRPNMPAS